MLTAIMISSGRVATSVINVFEAAGWAVQHRFDSNPAFIARFGYGDRRHFKSDDAPPTRIPEPTLTLRKGSTGVVCEVDYRYTKGSFAALAVIKQTKHKRKYLEKVFGGSIPSRILFGLALPDLENHIQKAIAHLSEVDFLLAAGQKLTLSCIKPPQKDAWATFASIPRR
jgi:hypothetical protein